MKRAVIIGGGPAGLMATEVLAGGGAQVDLYEAKPSVGRKFLLAGKGGLNLTHAEPLEQFYGRYGARRAEIESLLQQFGPNEVRAWVHGLGIETFVGSSRRVFPAEMKAAPLLRRWVQRLRGSGVNFHVRHRWQGWDADGTLLFAAPDGAKNVSSTVTILALGGGSWPQLGSDGAWMPLLRDLDVETAPLQASNCGFDAEWGKHFQQKFAGAPLKSVGLSFTNRSGQSFRRKGACVITAHGVEGSLIYAASALLRDEIAASGSATVHLDLAPDRTEADLYSKLSAPRGKRSLSTHLQRKANLKGVQIGLLRELVPDALADAAELVAAIKTLPLRLVATRPIEEVISSAGGVCFEGLNKHLMLKDRHGLFCAGEMLDWEAPTGGYLLTACLASGRAAGGGALEWLGD